MNITLRERLDAAERSKTALDEALRRMRIMGQGLDARLEKAQARVQAAVRPDVVLDLPVVNNAGLNVDFEVSVQRPNAVTAHPRLTLNFIPFPRHLRLWILLRRQRLKGPEPWRSICIIF